ncbi:MAG: cell division protein FtsX [Bacteroidales bacterium 45-6]|nr:MAG: cell division protein FtsX [Bacteroidales bacterium 45-6]
MSNKRRQIKSTTIFNAKVTTTISISLVLFLLGLTLLTAFTGRGISAFVKENLTISVVISGDMDKSATSKLQTAIQKKKYVKSLRFIGKEEIKKQLVEDLGRDPEEVLGYNPASDCFDIKLKPEYANPDSIKVVEKDLKGLNLVKNVMYSADDLRMVNTNLSRIGAGLLVLAIVLMVISFALVQNTIRLNIYSRRFLINTMRLVGATNSFIRKPFVTGMIVSGIVAAFLANLGILGLVYYFQQEYPDLLTIIDINNLFIVFGAVLALGILLTFVATVFAVNRYLRMKTDKFYYI